LEKHLKSQKKQKKSKISSEASSFWRFLENLAFSLGFALMVFTLSNVLLLLLQLFRTELILGIGIPLASIGFVYAHTQIKLSSDQKKFEKRFFNIAGLLFIVSWLFFNMQYNAQTVYLYRDPGLYNTTARWLMTNDNIDIPSINPFGEHDQLTTTSNAGVNMIAEDDDSLYTHGQRALPTLTATIGRLSSSERALDTNIMIGATALLSFYGFMGLFVKPRWAFLGMIVLSLSLPMLYFSRDMYTEPLSMLFFFTTLSLLYFAKTKEKKSLWFMSGLAAGAITMTRIDAYLGLIGLIVYLTIYTLLSSQKRTACINSMLFLAGSLITGVVAWLDLTQLGTAYYRFQDEKIELQLILLASLFVVGIVINIIMKNGFGRIKKLFSLRLVKYATLSFVVFGIIVLFARPLLIHGERYYEVQSIGGTESIVLQENQTEESRVYNEGEQVILWPSWYIGTLLCLISILGLLYMLYDAWSDENLLLLPFILGVVPILFFYLFLPYITRDHIWASRRLLPVIMPGIVVLAVYLLDRVILKKRFFSAGLYILTSVVFITGVLNTSGFFLKERVNYTSLHQIEEFCEGLPENSTVLLVGILGLVGTQTIYSYCQVPTVRFIGDREPIADDYRHFYAYATMSGYTPVVAALYEDRSLFADGSFVRDLPRYNYKTIEKVFEKKPEAMVDTSKQITFGILTSDGTLAQ